MAMTARYCSQCGALVEVRPIEGRDREVCPTCETVFYQNPLPVAASLLLNAEREVLLVKRKRAPLEGMWCLPIGFAETGETIAQAARRELGEETGIDGRIVRLLDVDSHYSYHYGDLLVVTFELQNVGGTEKAGDDAAEVAYFPLGSAPPLAFSSNQKAIRYCMLAHQDEWAIQDSFHHLHVDAVQPMLSDDLITVIQDRAAEITRAWITDICTRATTVSLRRVDPDRLLAFGVTVLTGYAAWLRGTDMEQQTRDLCHAAGRELGAQGCAAHELVSALTLLRKHVWAELRGRGAGDTPIDAYRILEFGRRTALFFDIALFHLTLGFTGKDRPGPQDE